MLVVKNSKMQSNVVKSQQMAIINMADFGLKYFLYHSCFTTQRYLLIEIRVVVCRDPRISVEFIHAIIDGMKEGNVMSQPRIDIAIDIGITMTTIKTSDTARVTM